MLYCVMLLLGPLVAFLVLHLPLFPVSMVLLLVAALGFYGYVAVDAARSSKRQETVFHSKAHHKWYVYALLVLASLIVQELVTRPAVRVFTQAFRIPSGSMMPMLQIGDHILVDKLRYHFTPIQRGDIVVFRFPQDETRSFIHRVIGLPGERLEIRGKRVLIDGVPLDESYVVYSDWTTSRLGEREKIGPFVIPPDRLFMMGDNRDHAMDSRYWGLLDVRKIQGKVAHIYFSWDSGAGAIRWARIGTEIH
jgi:signal peptidase I